MQYNFQEGKNDETYEKNIGGFPAHPRAGAGLMAGMSLRHLRIILLHNGTLEIPSNCQEKFYDGDGMNTQAGADEASIVPSPGFKILWILWYFDGVIKTG